MSHAKHPAHPDQCHGDVLLTLPAVNVIRDNVPGAKISFLVSKENSALVQGFREVNEIITLDRAALRTGNPFRVLPEFFKLLHRLRTESFRWWWISRDSERQRGWRVSRMQPNVGEASTDRVVNWPRPAGKSAMTKFTQRTGIYGSCRNAV